MTVMNDGDFYDGDDDDCVNDDDSDIRRDLKHMKICPPAPPPPLPVIMMSMMLVILVIKRNWFENSVG